MTVVVVVVVYFITNSVHELWLHTHTCCIVTSCYASVTHNLHFSSFLFTEPFNPQKYWWNSLSKLKTTGIREQRNSVWYYTEE